MSKRVEKEPNKSNKLLPLLRSISIVDLFRLANGYANNNDRSLVIKQTLTKIQLELFPLSFNYALNFT